MRVRDRQLLAELIAKNDVSMARLGRHANVSRQFIAMLVHGQKATCSERVGHMIAEFLSVPVSDLFVIRESSATGQKIVKCGTGRPVRKQAATRRTSGTAA